MSTLIIDFEASGLNTNTSRILEIGAMVTPNDFSTAIAGMNSLVWESGYPALTDEVIKVTNITQELLNQEARTMNEALEVLKTIVPDDLEYVCAFNTGYDLPLFREEMVRGGYSLDPVINNLLQLPWICGMVDVPSHQGYKSKRLSHLALEYGVTVNPKELHRAYGDVELTRKLLHAVPVTAEQMHAYQQIPWLVVKAMVTFDQKDLAKAQGYTWERVNGSDREYKKTWCKRIKQTELERELCHDFRVEQIQ